MPDDDLENYLDPKPARPKAAPDEDSALNLISKYESGNRNIPNYRFDPGHTAQGYYQITNTNWRNFGPQAGVDLSRHPNPMAAPKEVQANVARTMYRNRGFADWAPFNPALRAAIARGETGREPQQPGGVESYLDPTPQQPTQAPAPAQPRPQRRPQTIGAGVRTAPKTLGQGAQAGVRGEVNPFLDVPTAARIPLETLSQAGAGMAEGLAGVARINPALAGYRIGSGGQEMAEPVGPVLRTAAGETRKAIQEARQKEPLGPEVNLPLVGKTRPVETAQNLASAGIEYLPAAALGGPLGVAALTTGGQAGLASLGRGETPGQAAREALLTGGAVAGLGKAGELIGKGVGNIARYLTPAAEEAAPEGARFADIAQEARTQRVKEALGEPRTTGVPADVGEGAKVPPEGLPPTVETVGAGTSQLRHVDLQPRRVRGEGKGQFREETVAETESRRAQVNPDQQTQELKSAAQEAFKLPLIDESELSPRIKANPSQPFDVTYESPSGKQLTKTSTIADEMKDLSRKQKVLDTLVNCLHG